MTIQEQADAILDGWNSHQAQQDELLVKLAQDREALLDALKSHDAYMSAGYGDGPASSALHPWAAENWARARAAIAQAERPR